MSSSGFETLDRAKGVFAGQFTKWRAAVPCGHWQDPITVLVEKSVCPDRREPWRVPAPVGKSSNYISSLLLGRPRRHLTQVAGSTERPRGARRARISFRPVPALTARTAKRLPVPEIALCGGSSPLEANAFDRLPSAPKMSGILFSPAMHHRGTSTETVALLGLPRRPPCTWGWRNLSGTMECGSETRSDTHFSSRSSVYLGQCPT